MENNRNDGNKLGHQQDGAQREPGMGQQNQQGGKPGQQGGGRQAGRDNRSDQQDADRPDR